MTRKRKSKRSRKTYRGGEPKYVPSVLKPYTKEDSYKLLIEHIEYNLNLLNQEEGFLGRGKSQDSRFNGCFDYLVCMMNDERVKYKVSKELKDKIPEKIKKIEKLKKDFITLSILGKGDDALEFEVLIGCIEELGKTITEIKIYFEQVGPLGWGPLTPEYSKYIDFKSKRVQETIGKLKGLNKTGTGVQDNLTLYEFWRKNEGKDNVEVTDQIVQQILTVKK
jgi:hypothetical protein